MNEHEQRPESRREFLGAATAGAVGISAGVLNRSLRADDALQQENSSPGRFDVTSRRVVRAGDVTDLRLRFTPRSDLQQGARLWLFYDIRQGAEPGQFSDDSAANHVTVDVGTKDKPNVDVQTPQVPRTLDLFPLAPEFLHLVEITFDRLVAAGSDVDIEIRRWTGPQQPIDPFRFWLVVDERAEWEFAPIGFRRYRKFVRRGSDQRVPTEDLVRQTAVVALTVTGEYRAVPAERTRKTPSVYWGEFHGMVFNQRPLDDYYNYAKQISRLDFCAPFWFSYGTCVEDVWDEVKAAARRHTKPGEFVAIAGFECGTPPDGSHRCVLFPDAEHVPPIFCEDRPPAQEPFFLKRLHPDTIVCRSTNELYAAVEKYGGIVTGHFHTRRYEQEVLAEMFQKNLTRPDEEEQRLYELMRQGKRFALAGTSDTHDSMPGHPYPEPHLSMPAGVTAVLAEELTAESLFAAVRARRTYATTGARIQATFQSGDAPLGSELSRDTPRAFQIRVAGTTDLETVELLRDGNPIKTWRPQADTFSTDIADQEHEQPAFYLLRVKQVDQHQAWTSPIWFG